MTTEICPTVQAWDDAGRPHPYATFRDGYEAGKQAAAQIAEAYPFSPCIGQAIAELIREAGRKEG